MRRSPSTRRRALVTLGVAAGGALGLFPVRLARAHAIVVESEPAGGAILDRPPARVRLRFNSKIERSLSRLSLEGPGRQVAPLPLRASEPGASAPPDQLEALLPPLAPGAYAVRWRVLAADGHITEGAIRFTVKPGS